MALAVDGHPQKKYIIDSLLAGKSLRKIAATLEPPLHFASLQRYKLLIMRPALSHAASLAKVLGNGKSLSEEDLAKQAKGAATLALQSAPVLAVREQRIARLQDRADRLDLIMHERAEDMADAPGGRSGLLARKQKMIGSGPSAYGVTEYVLDTGLISELREHEKQAAMELGQWQEATASSTQIVIMAPTVNINAAADDNAWDSTVVDV